MNPVWVLLRFLGLALTGRVHFPRRRVGEVIPQVDGKHFVIFRHGIVDPPAGASPKAGATFVVRFHVANMTRAQNIRFSVLPLPFCMGVPGFRSKLWGYLEETNDFMGSYEWATVEDAQRYAQSSAMRFMTKRSLPGSVSFEIIPGDRLTATGA